MSVAPGRKRLVGDRDYRRDSLTWTGAQADYLFRSVVVCRGKVTCLAAKPLDARVFFGRAAIRRMSRRLAIETAMPWSVPSRRGLPADRVIAVRKELRMVGAGDSLSAGDRFSALWVCLGGLFRGDRLCDLAKLVRPL